MSHTDVWEGEGESSWAETATAHTLSWAPTWTIGEASKGQYSGGGGNESRDGGSYGKGSGCRALKLKLV